MKNFCSIVLCLCLLALCACGQVAPSPAESVTSAVTTATATTANPYPPIKSPVDFNHNGVDDYADIVLGAREDAMNRPRYDPAYFSGGYPPEDAGVCTDLVWRAFRYAGYDLKAMIDRDIKANVSKYPRVEGRPDRNIDFRRVSNLKVFFERHAKVLTTDLTRPEDWQPGDIVTFGVWHIAIVSDRRGESGRPYILHNMGQWEREDDTLANWEISGHFRFDASEVSADVLA